MDIRTYARRGAQLLAMAACMMALHSCDGMIYDDEGDCTPYYQVQFRYDYNMKYADAFAHEVETVTLYLVDNDSNVVWQKTESGEALAQDGYAMSVDVDPGTYSLLVWCGTDDKGSFTIPQTTVATELTCKLNRQYDDRGAAYVDTDLDRLYHGYLANQEFPSTEGTYTYTVPLVKNTNTVRVVLQDISGTAVDPDDYVFTITDSNGSMDWDNSLIDDEEINYHAWYTVGAQAGIDVTGSGTYTMNQAAMAELTIPRLMTTHSPRLTVSRAINGQLVLSIPLVDYALLVKGYYNQSMDDQEYLDRQDEYDMVFFLDVSGSWINNYIYINSWKVVLQDTEL